MRQITLGDRLLDFAISVAGVVDALPNTRLANHIAGQLIRSATSPAPNYEEACSGESRADFIHKTAICLKELRETHVWLKMIERSKFVPDTMICPVLDEGQQLCNIIAQSIITAKR
jgi:four helix bundle protein